MMAARARTVPASTTAKPEIVINPELVADLEAGTGLEITPDISPIEVPGPKPRSRATKRSAAAPIDAATKRSAAAPVDAATKRSTAAPVDAAAGDPAAGAAPTGIRPAEGMLTDPLPRAVGAEAAAAGLTMDPAHVPLRSAEEPWQVGELVAIADQLRSEHARLTTELSRAMGGIVELVTATDGAGDDQVDSGNQTFEREQEMSLAANIETLLDQTDRALVRLRTGSYGTCETCGNPVGKYRLQAYPRATLCVPCKQREERR